MFRLFAANRIIWNHSQEDVVPARLSNRQRTYCYRIRGGGSRTYSRPCGSEKTFYTSTFLQACRYATTFGGVNLRLKRKLKHLRTLKNLWSLYGEKLQQYEVQAAMMTDWTSIEQMADYM